MSEDQHEVLRSWYIANIPLYTALSNVAQSTIESLLKKEGIDYLGVTSRTKSQDSFLDKVKRKAYKKPEQEITDLSGIRVITFIESDVTKVCNLIETSFNVHKSKSLDKTNELGIDRFGYRSVHFVCDLGKARTYLPEFSLYKDLFFEVQVRTVLQHAWAEIEHDRNYKFAGILPTHLQRRLHLVAGVLEIADREFDALAKEVDYYAEEVSRQTRSGNLDIEVNTTSLLQFLPNKLSRLKRTEIDTESGFKYLDVVIGELRRFGVNTLSDLDKILNEDFLAAVDATQTDSTYLGLLRDGMMFSDLDRYFEKAWNHEWSWTPDDIIYLLSEKYELEKIEATFEKYGVMHGGLEEDEEE